jgi:hypothetical protein
VDSPYIAHQSPYIAHQLPYIAHWAPYIAHLQEAQVIENVGLYLIFSG